MAGIYGVIKMNNELEDRVVELEIQVALQNDLLDSLNATVAQLSQKNDLLQDQLRLIYRKMTEDEGSSLSKNLADEIPPHY